MIACHARRARRLIRVSWLAVAAGCPLTAQLWHRVDSTPGRTAGADMLIDPRSGRPLLHTVDGSMFVYVDHRFRAVPVQTSPRRRANPATATDPLVGIAVMFGGRDTTSYLSDTWLFDGTDWSELPTFLAPAPRNGSAMAWHGGSRRCVLFGGVAPLGPIGGPVPMADTWEFDGQNWLQVTTSAQPSARYFHSLAYDTHRDRVVLFGGSAGSTAQLADTWEWNGTSWSQLQPANSPPARERHVMGYDELRRRVVVFGGQTSPFGPGVLADTWEFDGSNWVQRSPTQNPGVRVGWTMAFDRTTQMLVLRGLENNADLPPNTWAWDGTNWITVEAPTCPLVTGQYMAAYDSAGDRIIRIGGLHTDRQVTYAWGGGTWRALPTANPPRIESGCALVHDLARQEVLLFSAGETWLWNGSGWRLASTTIRPRLFPALAFDEVRGEVVMFGGRDGLNGNLLGETWTWNGAAWTRRTPAASPPPRWAGGMVYSSGLGRAVLFGGYASPNYLADTWLWDGNNWQSVTSSAVPTARMYPMLAVKPASNNVVMGGGSGPGVGFDLWEFDGVNWTSTSNQLPSTGVLVSLPRRNALYDIGPTGTWVWATRTADVAEVGQGCAGGARPTPRLDATARPTPDAVLTFAVDRAAPASAAGLYFDTNLATVRLGPCTLYLAAPSPLAIVATDLLGNARATLRVPDNPHLIGRDLLAQAAVLAPQGAFAGVLDFTAALRLRFGH